MSGAATTGLFSVRVHRADFGGSPACWVGTARSWVSPMLPTNVSVEAATDLKVEVESYTDMSANLLLTALTPEEHGFIARLQPGGLIVAATNARGFRVGMEGETAIRSIGTCRSGAEIFSTPLVCSPLLPDLRFESDVIIGGVLYRDGTVHKTILPAHFDSTGSINVEFIRDAASRSSFCNILDVFQGTNVIGRYSNSP